MKEYKNIKKLIITILLVMMTFLGSVSVMAEPFTEETYAIESFVPETTAQVEDVTEGEQDATESSTAEPNTTVPATETEPEPTYRAPLPEITPEDVVIPDPIVDIKEENEPALFWGFVAWICIGVGVAVVLAVLLTTKTKAYRGSGKKRYSTGDKISGSKRLLNDKYYQNRKHK